MILLFIGCSQPSDLPVLHALDHDGDGVVGAAEYAAAARHAPEFAAVDLDRDGTLSAAEVEALVLATDPSTFDPSLIARPIAPRAPDARPLRPAARMLREALRFEVAEIRARAPDAVLPDEAAIRAAATQGLGSEAGKAVVEQLGAAAQGAGVVLPESLASRP